MEPASERIHLIDALRAIALFGVVTMNLTAMVMAFIGGKVMATAGPLDQTFATLDLVLLQGKARCTFALLFGVGFGILIDRARARGHGFTGFYLRRMLGLLALGLINLTFLYWGDILILYAVLGMVLLLFRRWSDSSILTLGLVLVIAPPLVLGLIEWAIGGPAPNLAGIPAGQGERMMAAAAPIYQAGDHASYILANLRYYADHHLTDTPSALVYDVGVLGLFLLGLWAARKDVLFEVDRWRPFLRRTAWLCLPVGLVISAVHGSRRMGIESEGGAYALVSAAYVGLPVMAFGYIAVAALFLTRGGRWLQPLLAPTGRMALTGYLASNLVGSFVFYGWGLGRMGDWNVAAMNLFAITVFAALTLFSSLWLKAFRFGPVEWLWRCVSYMRLQPIRDAGPKVAT